MQRLCDITLAVFGLILFAPLLLIIFFIGLFDTGSPLFRQVRVGRDQEPFTLVKFRTMKKGSISIATHLANPMSVTLFGKFLRRSKLDELPQLWNVLKGEMSMVGPRPCLPNQVEVIIARTEKDVFKFRPGITGLAQIYKVDMSTPKKLAQLDSEMLHSFTMNKYFLYIILTIIGKGGGDVIK